MSGSIAGSEVSKGDGAVMKIFLVMVEDHHTDVKAHPFSTLEVAIEFARKKAEELTGGEPDESMPYSDAWLYYACCSEEGDHVWIVEKELDQPQY